MPFVSRAQRDFMFINHPEIAAEWEKETPNWKKLPKHVKKNKLPKRKTMKKKASISLDPNVSAQIEALQSGKSLGYARRGFSLRHLLPSPAGSGMNKQPGMSGAFSPQNTKEVEGDPVPSQNGTVDQYAPAGLGGKEASAMIENKVAAIGVSKKTEPMVYRPINRRIYGPSGGIPFQKKPGIKNASQVLLSAFMGGVIDGFNKCGAFPNVDPSLFFEELLKVADTDCGTDDIREVRSEFITAWGIK